MFNVKDSIEACEFYQSVFNAEKISEIDMGAEGMLVTININGTNISLHPSVEKMSTHLIGPCAVFSTDDELRMAYDLLAKDAANAALHTDWSDWTSLGALITDKYGVTWMLSTGTS